MVLAVFKEPTPRHNKGEVISVQPLCKSLRCDTIIKHRPWIMEWESTFCELNHRKPVYQSMSFVPSKCDGNKLKSDRATAFLYIHKTNKQTNKQTNKKLQQQTNKQTKCSTFTSLLKKLQQWFYVDIYEVAKTSAYSTAWFTHIEAYMLNWTQLALH